MHPATSNIVPALRRFAIVLLFASVSCGGGGGDGGLTETFEVASVTVVPTTLSLAPGGSGQLTATPKDGGGNALAGRPVSWSSSNNAVATVSGGTVTGVGSGQAIITAKVSGVSTTAIAVVVQSAPKTFALTVSPSGSGSGIINGGSSGIGCTVYGEVSEGNCSGTFTEGTVVTLSALAHSTSVATNTGNVSTNTFDSWGGACTGASTCVVTMSQNRNVTAKFSAPPLEIQPYVPVPVSGPLHSMQYFKVTVPPGTPFMRVSATGGTAPPIPYVRAGSLPTLTAYDCAVLNGDFAGGCRINNPVAGTWYIALFGHIAYQSYLTVSLQQ